MTIRLSRKYRTDGFTLIELLVVLAILVAISAIGVQMVSGVDEKADDSLVRTEMLRVAEAVKKFRKDTGYWPKTGLFECLDTDTACKPPANFTQFYTDPSVVLSAAYEWRGPYLNGSTEGAVDIGQGCLDDGTACDPFDGTVLSDIPSVADPFTAGPDGNYMVWYSFATGAEVNRGRPYLLFTIGNPTGMTTCYVPCLVSFGPDGEYNNGGGDDIVLNF